MMHSVELPDWARKLDCAVTLCDRQAVVIYQNERSLAVNGDVRGRSLVPCHSPRSQAIIAGLLKEGGRNVYTISKRGVEKLIYQSAWYGDDGVGGLVELSIELPDRMAHYVRE